MQRFSQWLLSEKTTQKEIKKALSDDNIRIGVEFEFYLSDVSGGVSGWIEDAVTDWDNFRSSVENLRADREADEEEWLQEMYDEWIQPKIDELDDKLEELKKKREEIRSDWLDAKKNYDDALDKFDSKWKDLEPLYKKTLKDLNDEEDAILDKRSEALAKASEYAKSGDKEKEKEWVKKYDDYLPEIRKIRDKINNAKNETKKISDESGEIDKFEKIMDRFSAKIDKIDEEIDEVNSEFEYWNEKDKWDARDEAENNNQYYDFFERHPYENVDIDEDLIRFWDELGYGTTEQDARDAAFEYILYDDTSAYENLPYPDRYEDYNMGGDFEDTVYDSMPEDGLPFDLRDAEIGGYHSSNDYDSWRIEEDSSLDTGGFGVEVITPVLDMQEAMKVVPQMLKYIDKHGYTDKSCGMHVSISYDGKNLEKDLDLLKLMLFVEEGYVWKKFPEREGAYYVQSTLKKLKGSFHNSGKRIKQTPEDKKTGKVIDKVFDTFSKNMPGNTHSNSVNFEHLKKGRIEMRYLGGSNYEKKQKETIKTIGMFGHYLKLALDPKYKRKEYIQKLWRLYTHGQDKKDITLHWQQNKRGGKDRREQHRKELQKVAVDRKERRKKIRRAEYIATAQYDFFDLLDMEKKKGEK